jgi:hypothetical protein
MLGAADEAVDQRKLQPIAGAKENDRDRRHGDQRIDAEQREQQERRIHGGDRELAMREVHHAHDAEDHREPERHQPIDEPGQHALDHHFEVDRRVHCDTLRSCPVILRRPP